MNQYVNGLSAPGRLHHILCPELVFDLTPLLGRLRAIVDSVEHAGDRSSANHEFVDMVAAANVKDVLADIRERSPILADMKKKGEITIVGAMLNVSTGRVTFLE